MTFHGGQCCGRYRRGPLVPVLPWKMADPCGCAVGAIQYRLWDWYCGLLYLRLPILRIYLADKGSCARRGRLPCRVPLWTCHPAGHPHIK